MSALGGKRTLLEVAVSARICSVMIRLLTTAALTVSLASCTESFSIRKVAHATVEFRTTRLLFFSQRYEPCLKWVHVYRMEPEPTVVWSLEPERGTCVRVTRITLGSKVPGFRAKGTWPNTSFKARVTAEDSTGMRGGSVEMQMP